MDSRWLSRKVSLSSLCLYFLSLVRSARADFTSMEAIYVAGTIAVIYTIIFIILFIITCYVVRCCRKSKESKISPCNEWGKGHEYAEITPTTPRNIKSPISEDVDFESFGNPAYKSEDSSSTGSEISRSQKSGKRLHEARSATTVISNLSAIDNNYDYDMPSFSPQPPLEIVEESDENSVTMI